MSLSRIYILPAGKELTFSLIEVNYLPEKQTGEQNESLTAYRKKQT